MKLNEIKKLKEKKKATIRNRRRAGERIDDDMSVEDKFRVLLSR